jgi:carbon monoxide dehydrogenase subunit G
MKLEQSFTVTAPIDHVWDTLVDIEKVAPCLPGADITGKGEDDSYQGTFSVKLGPTTAAYRGSLKMESLDADAHVATMSARGTDKRGQGGASASIVSTLRQEGDDTHVDVATDFTITGRLASFGRSGMIEDISRRLMRDFAGCLQQRLAAERDSGATAAAHAPQPGAGAAEEPPAARDAAEADAALASAGGAASAAPSAERGSVVLWERIRRLFGRGKEN